MEKLPAYISLIFSLTTLLAAWLLFRASNHSKLVAILCILWLIAQGVIALTGFYKVTDTFPPRISLLVLPPLLLIAVLFITGKGRQFIDSLNTGTLTLLHIVRIPVELVLFWLYLNQGVPELMTFEGRNFDILAGLSAPFIYYFGYVRCILSRRFLLGWNLICLGLLLNIVTHGVLSVPTPFQQFGFEQPNIALLYFPYVWLPAFIVPLVLFSHLAYIRFLLRSHTSSAGKFRQAVSPS